MIKKYIDIIKKTRKLLSKQQIRLFYLLIVLALLAAALETIGVSAIIPLTEVFVSPEGIMQEGYLSKLNFLRDMNSAQVCKFVIFCVIIIYLIKDLFLIFYAFFKNKYAFKVQRELSIEMVKSYLNRGYNFFTMHNYAELNQGINGDIFNIYYVIIGLTNAITQCVVIIFICAFLFMSDWRLASFLFAGVVLCLLLVVFVFRRSMYRAGQKVRYYSILTNKKFKEMVLGIKDVITMRKQRFYLDVYEELTIKRQRYELVQNVGTEIPTHIIEGICVTGIMLVLSVIVNSVDNREMFISTLAAFALGSFKILPAIGNVSSALNLISSTAASIDAVYENILTARDINKIESMIEMKDDCRFKNHLFSDGIQIKNVTFSYIPDQRIILSDVSFFIAKGSSVALIGESGAGKSTLADIMLGLYPLSNGSVNMDDININSIPNLWARTIGVVPQHIYLSDESVLENVAFGEKKEDINIELVVDCLKKAKAYSFVSELPLGLDTEVGESGIRLSGGQRQRIGIARALYHNPEILILDEATSSLDNDTESSVMEAIESLHGSITLIIIAHRLSTVEKCDKIFEIKNGKAIERKYDDLRK